MYFYSYNLGRGDRTYSMTPNILAVLAWVRDLYPWEYAQPHRVAETQGITIEEAQAILDYLESAGLIQRAHFIPGFVAPLSDTNPPTPLRNIAVAPLRFTQSPKPSS